MRDRPYTQAMLDAAAEAYYEAMTSDRPYDRVAAILDAAFAARPIVTQAHNRSVTAPTSVTDLCQITSHGVERPHAVRGKGTSAGAPAPGRTGHG